MQIPDVPFASLIHGITSLPEADLASAVGAIADRLAKERESPGPEAERLFSVAFDTLTALPDWYVSESLVLALGRIAAYHQDNAHFEASLGPADAAARHAARLGNPTILARACKILGVARIYLGDFPGATVAFTQSLEASRAANDRREEAAAWNNLGLAHLSASQFGDAIAMFERTVDVAGDDPQLAGPRMLALSNIALASLQCGNIAKGIKAAQRASETASEPHTATDFLHRVNLESHYARLLLEIGQVAQARQHTQLMRQYAAKCSLELAKVNCALAEGLVEVASQNRDIGFSRLQGALKFARESMPYVLADALYTIMKAYEIDGQPDAALVYLRELVRLKQDVASLAVRSQLRHMANRDLSVDRDAARALHERQEDLRGRLVLHDSVRANFALLEQQSVAAELHDDTTGEHCYRVGRLASILAREYGVEEDVCYLIDLAARTHDIGKLGVPDAILLKPGKLTAEERAIMEAHTTIGASLLAKANVPQMYIAEEIAKHHHERWDGSGYPAKLKGASIPLAARITALADVYDALTHVRPYKRAWTAEESLREIAEQRGRHFDPELTDLFLRLVPRLRKEHGDLDAFLAVEAKNNDFVAKRAAVARALKGEDGAGIHLDDPRR
jgi:putative two-component system response regulator